MSKKISSVGELLDTLDDLADSESEVTVGDVTDKLGGRGVGPLILLPALLVMTPLGGIPTFPTVMAVLIALFAVQIFISGTGLWLPGFLRNRGVEDERVHNAVDKLRGPGEFLDKHIGNRLEQLTGPKMQRVVAGLILFLCLLVPPSEIFPFAALMPAGAIALLALGLTLKDGLVILVGLVLGGAALAALVWWIL